MSEGEKNLYVSPKESNESDIEGKKSFMRKFKFGHRTCHSSKLPFFNIAENSWRLRYPAILDFVN